MLISTSELLAKSWKIYLKNFKSLIAYIGLNILLVLVSFGIPVGILYVAKTSNSYGLIGLGFLLYILGLCAAIYGGLWLHIALLKAARNVVENKIISISEVLKKSRSLILPTLGTTLLKVTLIYLGLIAFIVPGIIMLVRYAFAEMVVVYDEPKEGAAAIRMSRAMVKGRWWGMLGRWIVVYIVPMIMVGVVAYIFSLAFQGPFVNAQTDDQVSIRTVDASEKAVVPYYKDLPYDYSELNDADLEKFMINSKLSGYKGGMGLNLRSPFTPRYFAFVGAMGVLTTLLTPYFLVAAGLLYTSAKQNQIKG